MAYTVHITRATEWSRSEETPISLEEWRAVIAADSSLESDDDDEIAADWNAHPNAYSLPLFQWVHGRISIDRPDAPTVGKAMRLARQLQARVVGDDGEVYEQQLSRDQDPRTSLTDRQKLVRHALNRGWFHGGSIRRGAVPRSVRLTVHTTDGRDYFLIVVHQRGPLRNVSDRTPIDVVPLSSDLQIEPHKFLGRTVGFRVRANGKEIAVRVKEPEIWIRWLQHPDQPVELKIT